VRAVFGITLPVALTLGAISVVALVLRFRRAGRFSARLRDQVDLKTLSAELLAVVDHTMRPTATSLWLRPSAADSAPSAPLARSRPARERPAVARRPANVGLDMPGSG
jgi:hypothetical protein